MQTSHDLHERMTALEKRVDSTIKELVREVIHQELKPIKATQQQHSDILQQHSDILQQHSDILQQHSKMLSEIRQDVKGINKVLSDNNLIIDNPDN